MHDEKAGRWEELRRLSKQSTRATEELESQHETAERAGTSNLNPLHSRHRCVAEYFTSSAEFNNRRYAADANKDGDADEEIPSGCLSV